MTKKKNVSPATVKERVNIVQCTFIAKSVHSVDDPITFPLINPNWVIPSHEDVLVLTVGLSGFDVHKILVDQGSFTNLLQMSAYKQIGHPPTALEKPG